MSRQSGSFCFPYNRVLAWVILSYLVVACGGESPFSKQPPSFTDQKKPIYGVYETDDGTIETEDGELLPISRAENLDTPHGVQGAVGRLSTLLQNGDHYIFCSGTLVSPRHIVTAAHCLILQGGATRPEGSVYVSFPQQPDEYFQESPGGRHSWTTIRHVSGNDLAVITLQTDVPKEIVQNYPRFNTEYVEDFIHRSFPPDYIVAGFGLSGPNTLDTIDDKKRRYGTPHFVELVLRGYPTPPILKSWFHLFYANVLYGDSGGPLFGRDPQTNEYILLGVNSGIDAFYNSYYAFLGYSDGHAHFLPPYLGPDGDRDSIPDVLDNCPPDFCRSKGLFAESCFNPDQRDDDGDGIGEACDNCPQVLCNQIGDGRSCVNVEQRDYDSDGIGDICDVCPLIASPEDKDPNGKAVGDACGCSGIITSYLTCEKNSPVCMDKNAGSCLYDFDTDGNPTEGRCSELADEDRDKIPDACDNSISAWDPYHRNSNRHTEEELGVGPQGDLIEGVPIFYFEQMIVTRPYSGVPEHIQALSGYPWLGLNGTNPVYISQPVIFRHCSCRGPFGRKLSTYECVKTRCRPSEAELDGTSWVPATTSETPTGPYDPPDGFFTSFHRYQPSIFVTHDPYAPRARWRDVYWHSFHDINRELNPVEGSGTVSYGLLASVVKRWSGVSASQRDSQHKLRTSIIAIQTGTIFDAVPRLNSSLLEERLQECHDFDCFNFLNFPTQQDLPLQPYPTDPMAVAIHEGTAGMLTHDSGFADVTTFLDPELIELLSTGEWVIISAEEGTSELLRSGLNRIGVVVPRAGSLGVKPVQLYDDDGIIRMREPPTFASDADHMAGAIQIHQGDRAVYSATQDRLFMAGTHPTLRVYDVSDSRYSLLSLDRGLSTTIGGLALDTRRNKLYILEIQDSAEYGQDATIFEYEVGPGASRLLWSVPWTGTYGRTALIVDAHDTLVLMGSKGQATESWRFRRDGAGLEQVGKRSDEGILFNEPHHSSRTAVMLLNDEIFLLDVHHEGFTGGPIIEEL